MTDPRDLDCFPYCPGVNMKKGYDNTAMNFISIVILLLILLLVCVLFMRRDIFFGVTEDEEGNVVFIDDEL